MLERINMMMAAAEEIIKIMDGFENEDVFAILCTLFDHYCEKLRMNKNDLISIIQMVNQQEGNMYIC